MFQIDFNRLKMDTIFIELIYNDIFSFPEDKYKLLEKLTPKYPSYNIESTDKVFLFNHENEIEIQIMINRMLIKWNKPKNTQEFLKVVRSIESVVKKTLRIQKYNRVGVRTLLGYEVETPASGQNYIFNRYFSNTAKNISSISNDIFNPIISFSGTNDNAQFNFAVRFQQKENINIEFGKAQPTFQQIENLIIFDVDIYKEHNITDNIMEKYFRTTENFISEKIIEYIKRVEK